MKFHAAVMREQGVTFAVVVVRSNVLRSMPECTRAQLTFGPAFPGLPIVLLARDQQGIPAFHGPRNIVALLSNIPLDAIAWREYVYGK
jgi:hypothetical protein